MVVVERVDVIIARDEGAFQQGFAARRRDIPPALGDPCLAVLIADGDADAAFRGIAQAKIDRESRSRGERAK
jgi:hypothetical protein